MTKIEAALSLLRAKRDEDNDIRCIHSEPYVRCEECPINGGVTNKTCYDKEKVSRLTEFLLEAWKRCEPL
jgi:hypothetical protein